MTTEWKDAVLALRYRAAESEDLKFVGLVDSAFGQCDLDTCRVLMQTFVTDEDFGVQESVISVLSTAKPEDRQMALLEELPRILVAAPESAADLVENEIRFHLASFRHSHRNATETAKAAVAEILENGSLARQFPGLKI